MVWKQRNFTGDANGYSSTLTVTFERKGNIFGAFHPRWQFQEFCFRAEEFASHSIEEGIKVSGDRGRYGVLSLLSCSCHCAMKCQFPWQQFQERHWTEGEDTVCHLWVFSDPRNRSFGDDKLPIVSYKWRS
jgi:hypothetical protein